MAALGAEWRKSSRSNGNGSCVKVRLVDGRVEIGDSKQDGLPQQSVLPFSAGGWAAFVQGVEAGEFDLT